MDISTDNFVLWQLQRTNKRTGKPVNLYHQELLKKGQAQINFEPSQ